jgi:hypothetical protein
MKHIGRNQHGTVVIEVTRSALFLKRPTGDTHAADS